MLSVRCTRQNKDDLIKYNWEDFWRQNSLTQGKSIYTQRWYRIFVKTNDVLTAFDFCFPFVKDGGLGDYARRCTLGLITSSRAQEGLHTSKKIDLTRSSPRDDFVTKLQIRGSLSSNLESGEGG